MKRAFVASAVVFAVLVCAVAAVALVSETSTRVEAAPCRCPLIYAPVICDHGKTYPNPCVADCHHAKNCVPTGEL